MPVTRLGLALSLACAACGGGAGSASINDGVPGSIFAPQTIFGWIQTETWQPSSQTYVPLTPEPLDIVVSGASFDPTQDLRTSGSTATQAIVQDENRNGYLQLWFPNVSLLQTGTPYTTQFGSTGDQPDAPFQFSFELGFAPLTNTNSAPSNPPIWGSSESLTVTFTSLGSRPGDSFSCDVVWTVAPFSGDPPGAVGGKMTMSLSGQLFNEELAACDASLTDPFNVSGVPDCNDYIFPAPTTN